MSSKACCPNDGSCAGEGEMLVAQMLEVKLISVSRGSALEEVLPGWEGRDMIGNGASMMMACSGKIQK